MPYILYENGKKIGEISDWKITELPAPTRMVLGKLITLPKPKDQCTFVSPKPVQRKSELLVVQDNKFEFQIRSTYVKDGTFITGDVLDQRKL